MTIGEIVFDIVKDASRYEKLLFLTFEFLLSSCNVLDDFLLFSIVR